VQLLEKKRKKRMNEAGDSKKKDLKENRREIESEKQISEDPKITETI